MFIYACVPSCDTQKSTKVKTTANKKRVARVYMLCVEQHPPELYEYLREMLRQDSGLRASVAAGRPLGILLLVLALPSPRRPRALALPLTLTHSLLTLSSAFSAPCVLWRFRSLLSRWVESF